MEIEYRHPAESDIGAMAEVINRSSRELRHHTERTPETFRAWTFGDVDYDPSGFLLGFADSEPVAYGGATVSKSRLAHGFRDGQISLHVVPEWRSDGIIATLFTRALDYLRFRGMESARLRVVDPAGWTGGIAAKYGMKDIQHGYSMLYDRPERPKAHPLPENCSYSHIMLEKTSEADMHELADIFNDAFSEGWEFSPSPAERFIRMRESTLRSREIEKRVTFVREAENMVGACTYEIAVQYNEQHSTSAGWINTIGVRKLYQRLGIGRALLSESMGWLRDRGVESIFIGVHAENSKALGLYLSQGFRIDQESVTYELKL